MGDYANREVAGYFTCVGVQFHEAGRAIMDNMATGNSCTLMFLVEAGNKYAIHPKGAVAVHVKSPKGDFVHLGYLPNDSLYDFFNDGIPVGMPFEVRDEDFVNAKYNDKGLQWFSFEIQERKEIDAGNSREAFTIHY